MKKLPRSGNALALFVLVLAAACCTHLVDASLFDRSGIVHAEPLLSGAALLQSRVTTAYLPAPQIQAVANETPAGTLDGVNAVFTLAANLYPASLMVFRNGLLQTPGADYAISYPGGVATLTFFAAGSPPGSPGSIPQPGDLLRAYYQRSL